MATAGGARRFAGRIRSRARTADGVLAGLAGAAVVDLAGRVGARVTGAPRPPTISVQLVAAGLRGSNSCDDGAAHHRLRRTITTRLRLETPTGPDANRTSCSPSPASAHPSGRATTLRRTTPTPLPVPAARPTPPPSSSPRSSSTWPPRTPPTGCCVAADESLTISENLRRSTCSDDQQAQTINMLRRSTGLDDQRELPAISALRARRFRSLSNRGGRSWMLRTGSSSSKPAENRRRSRRRDDGDARQGGQSANQGAGPIRRTASGSRDIPWWPVGRFLGRVAGGRTER